jgi:predicted transcriptional regulator
MTAIDILKVIEQNPRITPTEISQLLKVSAQHVRNILTVLAELGLVQTPARGVYVITNLGKHLLKESETRLKEKQ